MAHDDPPETEVSGLAAARPPQNDIVAKQLQAKLRGALVGVKVAPVSLGRFEIIEQLGAGGMGSVFAAFDPKLDRKVALKVLHASADRTRVLAEARALAKLTHPNVVAVYDASDEGDDLYIAMELVEGTNLRTWLAETKPAKEQVIAMLLAAGRGLAAAHAAGVVHGDIKPENILVAKESAKVADFGLARAEREIDETRAGTPAYMAPEQRAEGIVTARSDQYSFAVTLYEALTGKRPEIARLLDGARTNEDVSVRPAVYGALRRALAIEPTDRFATLDEMLAMLEPPRSRRSMFAVAVGVLVAAGGVVFALAHRTPAVLPCDGGAQQVAAVLAPYRAQLSPRAISALDAHGREWTQMAQETCEATRHGAQSASLLDLRMACLDRRLDELSAVVDEAARSTPDQQISAVLSLSSLAPCADREHLVGILPTPPGIRTEVDAFYKQYARVAARQNHSGIETSVKAAEALVAQARTLGHPPAIADSLLLLGNLRAQAGHNDLAEATLKEALTAAVTARDDDLTTEIWTARIAIALQRGKASDAIAYAEAAEAAASRLAKPDLPRGMIRNYLASADLQAEHVTEARKLAEESIVLVEKARGPMSPKVGEALATLVAVCLVQNDIPAATKAAERQLAIFQTAFGPDYQGTIAAMTSLANVQSTDGDLEAAVARYQDVLARTIAAVGPDHPLAADAHANLSLVLKKLDRTDDARKELEAARIIYARTPNDTPELLTTLVQLARMEEDLVVRKSKLEDILARQIPVFGETSHIVANTINDLGNMARDSGDYTAATDYFKRALAVYEKGLGPTNPQVAIALSNLGEVAITTKRYDDADAWCRRALSIDEPGLGPDHPDLAYDLTCIGEAELGRGKKVEALPLLERAYALRKKAKITGTDMDRTKAALARAKR
ncbi:MAG TPA: serine/threonine-protein kinase [Kofleriaceae bacterium]|jgi:tetratricopeptide (TPR) repeat protein/predicted Ser/Thr protein kinase